MTSGPACCACAYRATSPADLRGHFVAEHQMPVGDAERRVAAVMADPLLNGAALVKAQKPGGRPCAVPDVPKVLEVPASNGHAPGDPALESASDLYTVVDRPDGRTHAQHAIYAALRQTATTGRAIRVTGAIARLVRGHAYSALAAEGLRIRTRQDAEGSVVAWAERKAKRGKR